MKGKFEKIYSVTIEMTEKEMDGLGNICYEFSRAQYDHVGNYIQDDGENAELKKIGLAFSLELENVREGIYADQQNK